MASDRKVRPLFAIIPRICQRLQNLAPMSGILVFMKTSVKGIGNIILRNLTEEFRNKSLYFFSLFQDLSTTLMIGFGIKVTFF